MLLRNINVNTLMSHNDIKVWFARITAGLTIHHSSSRTETERTLIWVLHPRGEVWGCQNRERGFPKCQVT